MDQSAHDQLIDYLRQLYGDRLMERDSNSYPAIFYPAQSHLPDSVLSDEYPKELEDRGYPIYDRAHLSSRKQNRVMQNNLTWVMDTLETDTPKISGQLGYYFDMIATCDAIDHELRDFVTGKRADTPLRDKFHKTISPEQSLTSGGGRSAVIGVTTCTVFRTDDRYALLLGQRSHTQAVGAGRLHAVPAFVFQPSGSSSLYSAEWSLAHQALREYGEELFGMPEYEEWDGHITKADYFYDFPAVAELRTMLEDGRAKLQLTGIAFNLMTLRAEICMVLIIHDPDWYENWQQATAVQKNAEHHTLLNVTVDTLDGLPENFHARMQPHGAAAFWAAIDRARTIIKS